jgi:hypothetical protein
VIPSATPLGELPPFASQFPFPHPLDEDVIAWFRSQVDQAGGGNYQTLINDALRQHIARAREPLEQTPRRVIREEIRRAR